MPQQTATAACQTDGCPHAGKAVPVSFPMVGPWAFLSGPVCCSGCGMAMRLLVDKET